MSFAANPADAADYAVTNQVSCEAFIAGIGGTGSWSGGMCSVTSGTLPAGSTLTVGGAAAIRPQTGTFTNLGSITINSTGRGFYGAGTFANRGSINIVAASFPENYATITNTGLFQTGVTFGNFGTFTNVCNGTVVGAISGTAPVQDCSYVVTDQASCEAFITGIGGTGSWGGGMCSVTSGTLPEGGTLTVGGAAAIRPQTGTFTNLGAITINSTGRGFYGAGIFDNQGSLDIVAADDPENYATITNGGLFETAVPFGNYGTFTNTCTGTVVGTITGTAPVQDCSYVVTDQASCEAFIAGIGGTGSWSGGMCSVTSGTLPEGGTLTVGGAAAIRPQTGTFTNLGSITINSTGRGFYGAGIFDNQGNINIVAADDPENYATITNGGLFETAVPFGNYGTFTNTCTGTVVGTITGTPPVQDCSYVVTDQASCEAFIAGIGGTGSWSGGMCSVTSGTLPEGGTLTVGGAAAIRPQTGTFTNLGTITINSTGRGFYGAGIFDNQGSLDIVAADDPENYATITNGGLFQTAVPFGNFGTFTNTCTGTVVGTITGTAPVQDCSYVVTDQASCEAFISGIGGTGSWSGGMCSVTSGTLPAGGTLTVAGAAAIRPQTGTFTNLGTITINSTGRGFYGAGIFDNQGSLDIVAATDPENYATITNGGLFQTAVPFGNYGTFTNTCTGTVVGTITGTAPVQDCSYVVTDQASCEAFITGIGGTGSWSGGMCSVTSGTLPEGGTLTVGGAAAIRPQTGTFTNLGTITINSTGRGFYGAGIFDNQGSLDIVAATDPENYATITNGGLFETAVPFGNFGTFTNTCTGTVVGTISGTPPVEDCTSGVGDRPVVPTFRVGLPYPNPVRTQTTISLELPTPGDVSATVVDLSGRVVRTLAEERFLPAGTHSLSWDGRNGVGARAAAGTYYLRIRLGGVVTGRSLTVLNPR